MKTESINLTNWESVTLYQLVKQEYCNISDSMPVTEKTKQIKKAYNKLLDKLEGAIAKTID